MYKKRILFLIIMVLTMLSLAFHNDITLISATILTVICIIIRFAENSESQF